MDVNSSKSAKPMMPALVDEFLGLDEASLCNKLRRAANAVRRLKQSQALAMTEGRACAIQHIAHALAEHEAEINALYDALDLKEGTPSC